MDKLEFLILRNLIHNEEYVRKVLPFIKADYFENYNEKVVFEEVSKFVEEYNKPVTKEVLCIETEKRQDINDSSFKEVTQLISTLDDEPTEFNWLVNTTEKWCRDRAIYLALMESIQLADGKDETKDRDAIPSILSDALAVSFDTHIGHDYLEDTKNVMSSTIRKKTRLSLISNSSIKLRKAVYRIRLSTLLSLAQVLENLYSCVMWQAQLCSRERTSSTLLSKWQRKSLRRGSMLIYLMSQYKI